jgi:agmatine deiminase
MRKFLAALLLAGVIAPAVSANPLPIWLAPGEKPSKAVRVKAEPSVPPNTFRLPAEYEPAAAVVISWSAYPDMLTAIAQGVTGPGHAQIWVANGPDSISGVPADSYSKLSINTDSVWARDYGPYGLKGDGTPGIIDSIYRHYQERPQDDAFPTNLANAKNIPVYSMNMILDGGNVMVDSKGDMFMTKRTYLWNPSMTQDQVDSTLKQYFNVKNIYTFDYSGYPNDPVDGTGHIDMFMKLLNDHTVLVATADTDPYKSTGDKAIQYFTGRTAPDGQPYKVLTVKGWADASNNNTWYTYTNSLIINNAVLIPAYTGHDAENDAAKKAYEEGIPGITVVEVNADQSIVDGGAIHCETQVIPMLPAAKKADSSSDASKSLSTDYPAKTVNSPALQQLSTMAAN